MSVKKFVVISTRHFLADVHVHPDIMQIPPPSKTACAVSIILLKSATFKRVITQSTHDSRLQGLHVVSNCSGGKTNWTLPRMLITGLYTDPSIVNVMGR